LGNLQSSPKEEMNIYKWLWSKTTGRPFTYILRDIWHEAEWVFQTIFFGLGALTLWLTDWRWVGIIWCVYTLGYIGGHLWWGKKYQKGQGLPPNDKTLSSK